MRNLYIITVGLAFASAYYVIPLALALTGVVR